MRFSGGEEAQHVEGSPIQRAPIMIRQPGGVKMARARRLRGREPFEYSFSPEETSP
jgi:hypothetical protein